MKNLKVVFYSLVALVFVFLSFTIHWMFIIGAVILIFLNQKELMPKEERKTKESKKKENKRKTLKKEKKKPKKYNKRK